MATLLPQTVRVGDKERSCTWPPDAARGYVSLGAQSVSTNLLWVDAIAAPGVPDVWATALAFRWRLELKDEAAREMLRLLLLAQYLGSLECRTITLGGGSALSEVAGLALANKGITNRQLSIFRWTDEGSSSLAGRVVAASLPPDYTIFPSAETAGASGYEQLRAAVRLRASSMGIELDSAARLEPAGDALFRAALAGLALNAARVTPEGPWWASLSLIAAGAIAAQIVDTASLVLPWVPNTAWRCRAHESEGMSWAADRSLEPVFVSADQTQVLCPRHLTPIVDAKDQSVSLDALACAVANVNGQKELLIWKDVQRAAELKASVTDGGLSLAYAYGQGPTIVIRGRVAGLQDALCEPFPLPRGRSTIPVRREFLAYLKEDSHFESATQCWKVAFAGRPRVESIPAPSSSPASAVDGIVVWPREQIDGWRLFTLGAVVRQLDAASVVFKTGEGYRWDEYRSLPFSALLDQGVPKYVSFKKGNDQRGAVRVASRSEVPGADLRAHIAIDFGTSNTSVVYEVAPEFTTGLLQNGVQSAGDQCVLSDNGSRFPSSLRDTLDLFSGWYETTEPRPLLGTLLLERRSDTHIRANVVPREPDLVRNLRSATNTTVHADLKWRAEESYDSDALQRYMQCVLAPAFQAVRMRGARKLRVAATYPLAFEVTRLSRFKKAMTEALRTLGASTGTEIVNTVFVSESEAGMAGSPAPNANYTLTLDMGGGTTDFALMGDSQVIAADSVRIGGRALLKALWPSDQRSKLLQAIGASGDLDSNVTTATLLETLLHAGGVDRVLATLPPDSTLLTRQRIAALLASLLLVAERILVAGLPKETATPLTVNVALLGQGWHLLGSPLMQGFSEQKFVQVLGARQPARYSVQRVAMLQDPVERKLTVVRGAAECLKQNLPAAVKHHEATFVGLDLRLQNGTTLPAEDRLTATVNIQLATGDPGFAQVVEDVAKIATLLADAGFVVPSLVQWLHNNDPQYASQTRIQRLIAEGCHLTSRLIDPNGRSLSASPLVEFLHGPWMQMWTQQNAEV